MRAGMKLKKSEVLILFVFLLVIALTAGFFIHKRQIGSNSSQWSSYKEIDKNLFIAPNTRPNDRKRILKMVLQARKRVRVLFGDCKSNPIIIISETPNFGKRFGMKHDTGVTQDTFAGCYVVIGTKGLYVDVIAHELVHAELMERMGRLNGVIIPVWFQDGLADQVDLRAMFSEKEWIRWTRNGKKVIKMSKLETPKQFYVNDYAQRTYHYVLATHEVRNWLRIVGQKGLLELIDDVKNGDNLYKAFKKIEAEYKTNMQNEYSAAK